MLFSPAFFDPKEGLSTQVIDLCLHMVPTSTPMYAFSCSVEDRITICTTIGSSAIDMDRVREDATQDHHYDLDGQLRRAPASSSMATPTSATPSLVRPGSRWATH